MMKNFLEKTLFKAIALNLIIVPLFISARPQRREKISQPCCDLKPVKCSKVNASDTSCAPNELFFGERIAPIDICKNRYDFNTKSFYWNPGAPNPFQSTPLAAQRILQGLPSRFQVLFKQEIAVQRVKMNKTVTTLNGATFLPQIRTDLTPLAANEEIWFYDNLINDQDCYPIKLTSVGATQAQLAALPESDFYREVPQNAQFTATILKVKLDRYFYQIWAGGMNNDGTAIVKTRIVDPTTFIANSQGIFLRMAYLNKKTGKWIEFTPEFADSTFKNPTFPDADGMITWVVKNLKPGCEYAATAGEAIFPLEWKYYLDNKATNDPIFYGNQVGSFGSARDNARFKMPPLPSDKSNIKFAISSCNAGPINKVFGNAFSHQYDFYLWNGDTIYGDGAQVETTVPAWKAAFEEYWSQLFRADNFSHLFSSTGSYGLPDDHEVQNDWQVRGYWLNPNFVATQQERNINTYVSSVDAGAHQTVFSIVGPPPLSSTQLPVNPQIIVQSYNQFDRFLISRPYAQVLEKQRYFTVNWGQMDLITIDRMPYVDQETGIVTYHQEQGLYFPANQVEYLKKQLLNSKALVKVVFQSGIFGKTLANIPAAGYSSYAEKVYVETALKAKAGEAPGAPYSEVDARSAFFKAQIASNSDAVNIYKQVDDLMDFIIENDIKNVIFLGGGAHSTWARYYDTERCVLALQLSAAGSDVGTATPQVESSLPENNQAMIAAQINKNYAEINICPKKKIFKVNIIQNDFVLQEFSIKLK